MAIEGQPTTKTEVSTGNNRPTVTIDQEYFDWLRHGAHILANRLDIVDQNPTQSSGLKAPMGFRIDQHVPAPKEQPTPVISEPQA